MLQINIENKKKYKRISILTRGLSGRAFSCLKKVPQSKLPNSETTQEESLIDERTELTEDILSRSASDLEVSVRIRNSFTIEHIETIRQVLALSPVDIMQLKNMGKLSQQQLTEEIKLLYALGPDYFKPTVISKVRESVSADYQQGGKGFDFVVIDVLSERFFFKPVHMTEWVGLSRQGIYNAINKRSPKRREIWTGKELSDGERVILIGLINGRIFDYSDDNMTCYCMNDRKGDLACVFVYEDEIKCFFFADLPKDLQQMITDINYHKYTERELSGEVDGTVVFCIRKPYFLPKYPDKFRANGQLRGITSDEYAVFLSGYSLGDARAVNDDQVISFFQENMVDGKVYISSDYKNQWIRSLASRNGYAIKDFIKLYGFESKLDGSELTTDGARERHIEKLKQYVVFDNVVYFPTDSHIYKVFNTYCYNKGYSLNEYLKILGFERTTDRPEVVQDVTEKDMQVRQCEGGFEDKVFAYYPILGSKILKPEILDKLNEYTRKYIDTVLREPLTKLTLRAEMQITLALINNAKNWKNEENSNFWNYITLQFGYRDTNGAVVRLLQNSLESAMKKNRRLFIEDSNGRAFKSTAVIHALSSKKSWMVLFDFLFDFYKNNLNWKMIHGDPLIAVMIRCLQQKLGGDNTEDAELTISSRVYSFQEGIRKLILLRPMFTCDLFEKLIGKIDVLVNSENMPANTYEEQLCEKWFKEKIIAVANTKRTERQGCTGHRDVAIDYSRIRAKLVLENENDVQLVLPDIRLNSENVSRAVFAIYYNGTIAHQQNLSWYGNELGKTLNGVSISLPAFSGVMDEMNIQVRVTCDNTEIYNSEDTLYHRVLVFHGGNEITSSQMRCDNYTLVMPRETTLEIEHADITEIDSFKVCGLKICFVELKEGYILTVGGKLLSFDSFGGPNIRVIPPAESLKLPIVSTDETEYYFAYRGSSCSIILGNTDFLQQCILLKDGERIEFSELSKIEDSNGLAFDCSLDGAGGTTRIQILDLDSERLIFDRRFIKITSAKGSFNREFYFNQDDYKDASFTVSIDDFAEKVPFSQEDEEVRIPYRNGDLHVAIPKVQIEETTGAWMHGSVPVWYIGDIPQNSLLKVRNPAKTEIQFLVGGKDIKYDGQGIVTLGNVLQSSAGIEKFSVLEVKMVVKGNWQSNQYTLARICYKERFMNTPELWTRNNKLFWNQGGGFIGKAGRTFIVTLYGESDAPVEFKLDENTESVDIPENMEIGNYRYDISILSGGLFKKVKEVIAEGDCIVGDQNLLRFRNQRIVVDAITDEFNEESGHIQIRTCYIDKIKFIAIEETSEGYCPVYSGILYTTGYRGERYEFSFDAHTNNRGVTKTMVNPVRIVFVGASVLCITDSDGDGLYYYHYYDKYLKNAVYALTDHEYTTANKRMYSNADLYSYQTERI